MTAFDSQLADLRRQQDDLRTAYASTLAKIESKKELYQSGLASLKELGCETLEDAENRIVDLQNTLQTLIDEIKALV